MFDLGAMANNILYTYNKIPTKVWFFLNILKQIFTDIPRVKRIRRDTPESASVVPYLKF